MSIPLIDIIIMCSECGETATAEAINTDSIRCHTRTGSMARFPKDGLTPEQAEYTKRMYFLCECCQEEKDDRNDY
jgi:hypothetical protein